MKGETINSTKKRVETLLSENPYKQHDYRAYFMKLYGNNRYSYDLKAKNFMVDSNLDQNNKSSLSHEINPSKPNPDRRSLSII